MAKQRSSYSRRSVLKKGAVATGALVLGTTASGTAAAGIGDGRVADFHLNNINYDRNRGEIVGNHVHDASPENNHGTWEGDTDDPVVKDGAVGNAFEFDGGEYVEVGHDDSLNVTNVTVATWLKFNESADYHFFLSKRGSNDEYQMYCRGENAGSSSTELAYYDGATVYDADVDLLEGTWHHLAWVVSDETGFSGYIDGEEKVTKSNANTPVNTTNENLYIGTDNVGNSAKSKADEVRVYDRALSESEIQELADMDED